jgi:hypothetical protein
MPASPGGAAGPVAPTRARPAWPGASSRMRGSPGIPLKDPSSERNRSPPASASTRTASTASPLASCRIHAACSRPVDEHNTARGLFQPRLFLPRKVRLVRGTRSLATCRRGEHGTDAGGIHLYVRREHGHGATMNGDGRHGQREDDVRCRRHQRPHVHQAERNQTNCTHFERLSIPAERITTGRHHGAHDGDIDDAQTLTFASPSSLARHGWQVRGGSGVGQ